MLQAAMCVTDRIVETAASTTEQIRTDRLEKNNQTIFKEQHGLAPLSKLLTFQMCLTRTDDKLCGSVLQTPKLVL